MSIGRQGHWASYAASQPLRVVYIMGSGRSGSTMLDTILGNHPDIESVGELSNVVSSDWVAGAYCACGQRGEQCLFWRDVLRQWRTRCSLQDGPQFQALIEHWEQGRWAMNRVWQERRRPSAAFGAYLAGTRAVFEAIRATSGKPMIVDSSKSPARCLAIAMIPGIDLRVIHLVRDARGVAWSGMKKVLKNERGGVARDLPVHRSWRVALGWVVTNSRAEWLCRRLDPARSCRVRYEDYVADPAGALSRIGGVLGADLGPLAAAAEAGQEMEVRHTIAGNRMRMAGRVRLRADVEWQEKMSPWDRWLCWTLAGWKLRQYGYEKDPPRDAGGRLKPPEAVRGDSPLLTGAQSKAA